MEGVLAFDVIGMLQCFDLFGSEFSECLFFCLQCAARELRRRRFNNGQPFEGGDIPTLAMCVPLAH
eukprot:6907889-Lingulodinium_polyedra.AAC.1